MNKKDLTIADVMSQEEYDEITKQKQIKARKWKREYNAQTFTSIKVYIPTAEKLKHLAERKKVSYAKLMELLVDRELKEQ